MKEIKPRAKKTSTYKKFKYKGYNYEIGGVDSVTKDNSCYINISTWVQPEDEEFLKTHINTFKRYFKVFSRKISDVYFDDLEYTIMRDVSYSETNRYQTNNKYTFMSIELFYLFNEKINMKSKDRKYQLQKMGETIIDWLLLYSEGLLIAPIKKGDI